MITKGMMMIMMMKTTMMMIFTVSSTWFVLTRGFLDPTELHWDFTLRSNILYSYDHDHDHEGHIGNDMTMI